MSSPSFQCHYEVLSVPRDADAGTIKKAHRKLAVKFHPDKNFGDDTAAEKFRSIQEAYECLSDVGERKWYDEHREALLKGWSPNHNGQSSGDHDDMLFDLIPFMHAHCYTGYGDADPNSFYTIYGHVFASLAKEEADAVEAAGNDNNNNTHDVYLPMEFGNGTTPPKQTATFYQSWEGFVSRQSFAWADKYDAKEADHRRMRRAMDEENTKARKAARKSRNEDVLALVQFVKRRDPRMKRLREQQDQEKAALAQQRAERAKQKKQETLQAREEWRERAEQEQARADEMDRLAGRVRLADLEDDYDYGGGKKKGKKGKKKGKHNFAEDMEEEENHQGAGDNEQEDEKQGDAEDEQAATETTTNEEEHATDIGNDQEVEGGASLDETVEKTSVDAASPAVSQTQEQDVSFSEEEEEEESESSEEPDVWRCECCRKDFKSPGQMENHMKSKKHKEAYKKYQKKIEQEMMKA